MSSQMVALCDVYRSMFLLLPTEGRCNVHDVQQEAEQWNRVNRMLKEEWVTQSGVVAALQMILPLEMFVI